MNQPAQPARLFLASGSPRRRELLSRGGFRFEVLANAEEEPDPAAFASPEEYVFATARLKALAAARRLRTDEGVTRDSGPSAWILAADTVAALGSEILGKPSGRADARRILRTLAGACHRVLTGVYLQRASDLLALSHVATTGVRMRALAPGEIEAYLDSGLWEGKAGAYGIQDQGDPFVEAMEGSFTNVVGLPMEETARMLRCARELEALLERGK